MRVLNDCPCILHISGSLARMSREGPPWWINCLFNFPRGQSSSLACTHTHTCFPFVIHMHFHGHVHLQTLQPRDESTATRSLSFSSLCPPTRWFTWGLSHNWIGEGGKVVTQTPRDTSLYTILFPAILQGLDSNIQPAVQIIGEAVSNYGHPWIRAHDGHLNNDLSSGKGKLSEHSRLLNKPLVLIFTLSMALMTC